MKKHSPLLIVIGLLDIALLIGTLIPVNRLLLLIKTPGYIRNNADDKVTLTICFISCILSVFAFLFSLTRGIHHKLTIKFPIGIWVINAILGATIFITMVICYPHK